MLIDHRNLVHCGILLIQVYSRIKDDLNKTYLVRVIGAPRWQGLNEWTLVSFDPTQCGLGKENDKMSTGKMKCL